MIGKRSITVILVLTVFLSIIVPFILRDKTETINQTVNIIATIISSVASLITLSIAIILFNKFGIETPLLEKNTEVVFSFIEEFKKIRFMINGKGYTLIVRLYSPYNTAFESHYGEKLSFSTDYFNNLEALFTIAESPFMPKSIYEKLDKLRFQVLSMDIKEEDIVEYATVNVLGKPNNNEKFGRFDQKDLTLFEFLNLADELKIEIIRWINKNSTYSPDLNLE